MNKLKLFIVIAFYSIWWGGFTFYSSIVIPEGMKILGDHVRMGLITETVSNYLNIIGTVTLFISFVLLLQNKKSANSKIGWEWFVLVILQLLLFYIHHLLSSMISQNGSKIDLQENFYSVHRIYLLTSTAMWLFIPLVFYRLIKPFLK